MSKRTSFTTTTPLPPTISRRTALAYLHDHLAMIDLNPLVQSRHHLLSPPANAPASEFQSAWYSITDRLAPGFPSPVSYTASFRNLSDGLQTHIYAPMGLDIRGQWTVRDSGDIERAAPGGPETGLYLREDVEMKSNVLVTGFVKKTLRKAHAGLVERMVAEAETGRVMFSPVDAFHFFADDETFLGPGGAQASKRDPERSIRISHAAGARSFFTPPSPKALPPPPTAAPASPPPFLQAPQPRSLNPTQPPSSLQNPEPEASAAPSPPGPYPAPLRVIPQRHTTCLSSLSPTPSSPSSHWTCDTSPRPESTIPQRSVSVVSRYPDAANQDYSDIAAMNPFDSPVDPSPPDTFSFVSTGSAPPDSPLTPVAESPAESPATHAFRLRFEFDFDLESEADDAHGLGIKAAVPGEKLEERYELLEGRLPVLVDKRASGQRVKKARASLRGPVCYAVY